MIPKSKRQALKSSASRKKELESKRSGERQPSIFFKALVGEEKEQRWEILPMTPGYTLPEYRNVFDSDPALGMSILVDHHEIRIGKTFYSIPCKRQVIDYPFVTANVNKEKCPVCSVGYELKKRYYERVNKEKEAAGGNYDDIPEDVKNDLKAERLVWWKITNKRGNEYMPIIAIRVDKDNKGKLSYSVQPTVKWWKIPGNLISQIESLEEEGVYPFAEDYLNEDLDISYDKEFCPSYYFKVQAKKNNNPYYTISPFANTSKSYKITRLSGENGDVLKIVDKNKDIDIELPIPDAYDYFKTKFEKWDENTSVESFADEFNIDIKNTSNDGDSEEEIKPLDDEILEDYSEEFEEPETPKKSTAKKRPRKKTEDEAF